MIKHVAVALIVFIVYILFSGSITIYDAVTGTIVAALCSYFITPYIVQNEGKLWQPKRLLTLMAYFVKYITIIEFKAHMDVVKRIFTLEINPGIVKIPLKAQSDWARLLVASSITNTPGTVVVDEKDGYFYVNWINVTTTSPEEARVIISEEFEKAAVKIFD
ncbi:MAG: Na+/H+ antiporter subunit E [Thermosphaera sp.]